MWALAEGRAHATVLRQDIFSHFLTGTTGSRDWPMNSVVVVLDPLPSTAIVTDISSEPQLVYQSSTA